MRRPTGTPSNNSSTVYGPAAGGSLRRQRHVAAGRRFRVADGDELGVLAAEAFGDVAVPADRQVSAEREGEVFGRQVAALEGAAVREAQQRGLVRVPAQLADGLVAEGARTALVEVGEHRADGAVLGRVGDL